MKKTLALCLSIAAACTAYAQSSVTTYGVLDLSVGASNTGSGTTLPGGSVQTASSRNLVREEPGLGYGSRLGFRGTEDLGGGLRANFLMEMGIAADTGGLNQGGLSWGRQIYVGLGGTNWSLSVGRQYTPINFAIAASEPLGGSYWGQITTEAVSIYESIGSTASSGTFQLAARANNSLLATGTAGGLTGNLMLALGDENSRGTGRFINHSLTYSAGPLRADASYARIRQNVEQITGTAVPEWTTMWSLGGSYDFGVIRLFAGAFESTAAKNKANYSAVNIVGAAGANGQAYGWDKNRIFWTGASAPLGLGVLKAQVARQSFPYASGAEGKATVWGVVYEYYLSKRTTLYGSGGAINNNEHSRSPLYGAITQVGLNGYGADPRALSVGMVHRF